MDHLLPQQNWKQIKKPARTEDGLGSRATIVIAYQHLPHARGILCVSLVLGATQQQGLYTGYLLFWLQSWQRVICLSLRPAFQRQNWRGHQQCMCAAP